MSLPKASLSDLRIERRDRKHSSTGAWLFLLVILLAGLIAAGVWWLQRPKALEVHTSVVRESTSSAGATERTVLNASGYVTARREATVSSKITGKVIEVFVEEGMKVTEGKVLARLDDTNLTASLQLALAQLDATKASLAETRVRVKEADREYQRQLQLSKQVVAQSDTDKAEATLLALKAKLQQQQAEIAVADRTVGSWKQQWDDTIIRAPFAGIVTSKNAQPGEMISPMSAGGFTRTGICTIVDMESLEIEIDVNESYINRVQAGQQVEATLDAYPDWKIPCKVIAIIPTADRQKSTVKVRVGFVKLDPRILPEMSVKVGFREAGISSEPGKSNAGEGLTSKTLIVPATAVTEENRRDYIFVVRNGHVERRAVTVASRGKDEVVLSAGVSAGERVVLERPEGLKDGALVKDLDQ